MINGHGDDLHRYRAGQITSNFSTNIPTPAARHELMAWLAARPELLSSYPEPEPLTLERQIARREGVEPEAVMVTAGATQAIYLAAAARREARSAILVPTFAEYEDACRLSSHTITYAADLQGAAEADVAWICNPCNPTGHVLPHDEILRFITDGTPRLNIIDAAYAAYTPLPTLSSAEAIASRTTILLRSLTKDYGVPGLRVGYAVGDPDILAPLRAQRMPWAVGAIPLAAAQWLIDHAEPHADPRLLHAEALRLARELRTMGITVLPTDTNFILASLPDGLRAADLKEALAAEGMLIRDASNFHGLTPSHFRIAALTPAEGDRLITAIRRWITLSLPSSPC